MLSEQGEAQSWTVLLSERRPLCSSPPLNGWSLASQQNCALLRRSFAMEWPHCFLCHTNEGVGEDPFHQDTRLPQAGTNERVWLVGPVAEGEGQVVPELIRKSMWLM